MSDYIYIDEKARRKALSTKTREYLIKRILDLEEENKDREYEAKNRDYMNAGLAEEMIKQLELRGKKAMKIYAYQGISNEILTFKRERITYKNENAEYLGNFEVKLEDTCDEENVKQSELLQTKEKELESRIEWYKGETKRLKRLIDELNQENYNLNILLIAATIPIKKTETFIIVEEYGKYILSFKNIKPTTFKLSYNKIDEFKDDGLGHITTKYGTGWYGNIDYNKSEIHLITAYFKLGDTFKVEYEVK